MRKKGFTLIELLAAIVILSLLMITAVPSTINLLDRNKKQKDIANAKKLISFAETYMRKNNIVYPTDNQFLVLGYDILNDGSLVSDSEGKNYSSANSFVAIKKVSQGSNYTYDFYVQLVNGERHGIKLSSSSELDGENKFKLITDNVPNNDCSGSSCPNISKKLFNNNPNYNAIALSRNSELNMASARKKCNEGYPVVDGCLIYKEANKNSKCDPGYEVSEEQGYCYGGLNDSTTGQGSVGPVKINYKHEINKLKMVVALACNEKGYMSCELIGVEMDLGGTGSVVIPSYNSCTTGLGCTLKYNYFNCDGYIHDNKCYTTRAAIKYDYNCVGFGEGFTLTNDHKCEKKVEYSYTCNDVGGTLVGQKCIRNGG